MGEGLLTEMEMTQNQLLYQSPPQHKRQLTNVGDIEHLDQPVGSSTGRRVSFLGASVDLSLFQEAWLVSASSRQLARFQGLL